MSTVCNVSNATGNSTQAHQKTMMSIRLSVLGVIFFLALVGNGCVILALLPRWKKLARVHHFMLNLSIADICVAFGTILPMILVLVLEEHNTWTVGGDAFCKLMSFISVFPVYASSYILVMTAVDRFIAICYPLKNYSWTITRTYLTIALAWGIGFLLALPQLYFFSSQYNKKKDKYMCLDIHRTLKPWVETAYTFYYIGFNFFIPLILLIIAYGRISYTVWVNVHSKTNPKARSNGLQREYSSQTDGNFVSVISKSASTDKSEFKASNNIVPRSHSRRAFSRAKMKTVTLTFVVVCAFIVCWIPFSVMMVWWSLDECLLHKPVAGDVLTVFALLTFLNSCCNPYIYIFFTYTTIKRFFPCHRFCNSIQSKSVSSNTTNISYCVNKRHATDVLELSEIRPQAAEDDTNVTLTFVDTKVDDVVDSDGEKDCIRLSDEDFDYVELGPPKHIVQDNKSEKSQIRVNKDAHADIRNVPYDVNLKVSEPETVGKFNFPRIEIIDVEV